jgi:DNA repair photolyase
MWSAIAHRARRTDEGQTMTAPASGGQRLRLIGEAERRDLDPSLGEVIEYRKSGLSVNWIVGCPLDCGYCVRHLFGNFAMKQPRALISDQEAFDRLVGHPGFVRDVTPIQVLNRATDPMVPLVKPRTFAMLQMLDDAGLRNHVLVITRWRIDDEDCAALNALRNVRVTLLVTHSGINDERIEPVDAGIAVRSMVTAYRNAQRYRVVFYWRPLVPGLNDSDADLARAMTLTRVAHATVFTGLYFRKQIRDYYRKHELPEPYRETARRKILPERLEQRVLTAAAARAGGSPLFRKTSCAVAYVHGMADYNGHYGIRELCDICPAVQQGRCRRAWTRPDPAALAAAVGGLGGELVEFTDRAVVVAGLDEGQRYRLQHGFGYQIHDVDKPHHRDRHGRADLGWASPDPSADDRGEETTP